MKRILYFALASCAAGQSLERANLFREFALIADAKREYISVVTAAAPAEDKAAALNALGLIALEEGNRALALKTWNQLALTYPDSSIAASVRSNISTLKNEISEPISTPNPVAAAYISHGDFWASERTGIVIDTSWIDELTAALKWYDRVIAEFPKSVSAEMAHRRKFRTIMGWGKSSEYGMGVGIKFAPKRYLPDLLAAFANFEADFPNSAALQECRYDIAQVYWRMNDEENAKKWLNTVIEKSGEQDTFYRDLAQRRLRNFRG